MFHRLIFRGLYDWQDFNEQLGQEEGEKAPHNYPFWLEAPRLSTSLAWHTCDSVWGAGVILRTDNISMICFETGSDSAHRAHLCPQTVCRRSKAEIEHMRYRAWATHPEEKPAGFPCCCMHTSKMEGKTKMPAGGQSSECIFSQLLSSLPL